MALGNGNVELKVTLDAQGVVTGIQSIAKAETDLKQTTEQTSQGFTTFQSTLITLNQALDLGSRAFGILKSAAGTAIEAVSRGSDIDDVTNSFSKLSDQAGILSDVFLNDLRAATAGTVDDFTLQQKAIEAVRAGAKPDEFVALTKAARVLSDQVGGDLTQSLDELSNAFETGQVKGLKNKLGIIDLEKAETDFANALGKTRDQLTREQQVQADRAAIIEAAKNKQSDFNRIALDGGDAVNQLKTAIGNARDKMFVAIGTNEDLRRTLVGIKEAIEQIDWQSVVKGINSIISASSQSIQGISKLPEFFRQFYAALKDKGMQRDIAEGTKSLDDVMDLAILKMAQMEVDAATHGAAIKETIKEVGTALLDVYGPGNEAGEIAYNLEIQRIKDLAEKRKAQAAEAEEAAKRALSLQQQRIDMQERFNESLDSAYAAAIKVDNTQSEQYQQAIANGLSTAFSGDFKGALRGAGSSAGAALGTSIGGPIGGAIGAEIGDKIGKGIYDGLNHVFGGGNDKENNARKSLDQFFASIFKDNPLQVQLEKQLSTITDLNFGGSHGFDNGGFGKIFDSIEPAAREAFRGVGVAMNELLGTGEDIGSQLGHVFAENLGGDLNNLQLLVQATGKTFEEMKNSVVEAFLDGKLSALEAQTAIDGVRQVMEVGIPGAVGATTQAFDNLIKSTAKGGRATVDAIGDIAAEAEEKGVPSISALQTELEGAFDKDKVDAFFKALSDFGITTLDQLKNSSVDTRLALAATLEGQGSFFDVAQAKVDDIVNKLNSIPERFESDYVINVKLNGTADAQTIASKAISGESFHQ